MLRPDGGPAVRAGSDAETDVAGSALLVDVDAVADGQVSQGVDGSLPAVRLLADLEPAGQRGATDESACTPGTDPGMSIIIG